MEFMPLSGFFIALSKKNAESSTLRFYYHDNKQNIYHRGQEGTEKQRLLEIVFAIVKGRFQARLFHPQADQPMAGLETEVSFMSPIFSSSKVFCQISGQRFVVHKFANPPLVPSSVLALRSSTR